MTTRSSGLPSRSPGSWTGFRSGLSRRKTRRPDGSTRRTASRARRLVFDSRESIPCSTTPVEAAHSFPSPSGFGRPEERISPKTWSNSLGAQSAGTRASTCRKATTHLMVSSSGSRATCVQSYLCPPLTGAHAHSIFCESGLPASRLFDGGRSRCPAIGGCSLHIGPDRRDIRVPFADLDRMGHRATGASVGSLVWTQCSPAGGDCPLRRRRRHHPRTSLLGGTEPENAPACRV